MTPKKTSHVVLVWFSILLISLFGLSGCGGSDNSKQKPTMDVAVMARQTVSAIYTQTAIAAAPTQPVVPTAEPSSTPTQAPPEPTAASQSPTAPSQPPAATGVSAVETPGGVGIEPTRNVSFETPSGKVTMEPYKGATTEPTKTN
jgi:hypothetical protein